MKKVDVKALSKEQKLLMLDALKEKSRRDKLKKAKYTPNDGQMRVHRCDKPFRFCFAANSGGKTTLAVNEVMWAANGYNPILDKNSQVPARIYVILDHPDKVRDVWLSEMRKWHHIEDEWLHKNGKPYINEIKFPNGSFIKFLFHQQDDLTYEGLELDYCFFDEPCPRNIWIALRRGGRTKGRPARFLLIGTPIKAAWLRKDIYEPWQKGDLPDHECFIYGAEVNKKNVNEEWYNSFFSSLTEKERKVRQEGMFFDTESLALASIFKRQVHVVSHPYFNRMVDPTHLQVVIAVDPHPSKAHVAVMLGADREGHLYYIGEMSEKMLARQFAHKLIEWAQGHNVVDIVCDSLGSAQMTSGEGFRSFIEVLNEVLRKKGWRARPTTFKEKDNEDFIERIREVLHIPEKPNNFGLYIPKLRILEGNPGIIKDIENVAWMQYKDIDQSKPILDIRQCDYLACLKYGLAANPARSQYNNKIYTPQRALYGMGQSTSKTVLQYRDRKTAINDFWNDTFDDD